MYYYTSKINYNSTFIGYNLRFRFSLIRHHMDEKHRFYAKLKEDDECHISVSALFENLIKTRSVTFGSFLFKEDIGKDQNENFKMK